MLGIPYALLFSIDVRSHQPLFWILAVLGAIVLSMASVFTRLEKSYDP